MKPNTKPKGLAAMMIAIKPKEAPGSDSKMPSSESPDKAIGMVFEALQDGDREGFIEAFKAAHSSCSEGYGEEE